MVGQSGKFCKELSGEDIYVGCRCACDLNTCAHIPSSLIPFRGPVPDMNIYDMLCYPSDCGRLKHKKSTKGDWWYPDSSGRGKLGECLCRISQRA